MESSCSVIGENSIFFGIYFSVSFAPRILASADFPTEFFVFFVPTGKNIPCNTMIYCLEYLMSIIKLAPVSCSWKVLFYWGKQPFLWLPERPVSSSLWWFLGKFYRLFIPTGSAILVNIRILTGILHFYFKAKIKSTGEKKWSYKNNKKGLQNFPPWNLELLALISARAEETSCTKAHISPRKKVQFPDVLHITENLTTRTVLQSSARLQKWTFLKKNEHL